MTSEEKQEIIAAVLSAIKTNSALITDLTEVTTVPDDGYIELSGGRRIKGSTLQSIIQAAIADNLVSPAIAAEQTAREEADALKFDKADIVQETGTDRGKVMSQYGVTEAIAALQRALTRGLADEAALRDAAVESETKAREEADALKFDIADIVQELGTATDKVMSQNAVNAAIMQEGKRAEEEEGNLSDNISNEEIRAKGAEESLLKEIQRTDLSIEQDWMSEEKQIARENIEAASESDVQDLQDLVESIEKKVFPLYIDSETSNAGDYEYGEVFTPTVSFRVMRKGVNVSEDSIITGGSSQSYDPNTGLVTITSMAAPRDFSIAVNIKQGDDTISRTYSYNYKHYIYGTTFLDGQVEDPTSLIGSGCSLFKLSNDTTLGENKLNARQCYIFAVPGNVNLVVREASTGGIIDNCTTGTIDVARQCDPETTDTYSYVIVPASVTSWSFKITNS